METNVEVLENFPQKSTEKLKIKYELMDFSSKAAARLTITVAKTLDKCMDFDKKVLTTHNTCQNYAEKRLQEFPGQ